MRLKIPRIKYGQTKIVTKFLIFPKEIKGELRWLEKATYERFYGMYGWYNTRWID